MEGHIKLYRKFLEWEWYSDINTKMVFIHMLLKANWREGSFKGVTIPRGSFVSSLPKLVCETGLTEREIRTAIAHLKKTGEVTDKPTNKYTVFTISNYDSYQTNDKQNDIQETDERHSNDILTTTIEEDKENKELNNNICAFEIVGGSSDSDKKAEAKRRKDERRVAVLELFEDLWKLYPHKRGKDKVSFSEKEEVYKIGRERMVVGIERYKAEWERDKGWRKALYGSSFFKGGYKDYIADDYTPLETGSKPAEKAPAGKGNQFHNFHQRDTDYDAIMLQDLQRQGKDDSNNGE